MTIDYDYESYFELSEDELASCNRLNEAFLCSPKVIKKIIKMPNCTIDVIFKLAFKPSCRRVLLQVTGPYYASTPFRYRPALLVMIM